MELLADTIFTNGNVITMDEHMKRASAIVIQQDRIIYVGDKETALSFRGSKTEVIDLQQKTVLPGFIESHIHPVSYALNLLEVDCRPTNAPSIDRILELIKEAADKTPKGEWIRGFGWDDSRLKERLIPTRWDLDKVSPDHPVALLRTCNHMSVLNSKALEMSGITNETKDPQGGHLERDEDGVLTGLVQERALELIGAPDYGIEDIYKGMKFAQKDFAKWGVTTVHDMSMQDTHLQVYQQLLHNDDLTVRIRPWIWAIDGNGWDGRLDETIALGIKSGFGNDMIKLQGMKFMLDGSIGGRTAALAEPYENDTNRGILYNDVDEVSPYMTKALQAGLRVAIHGIGERAIEVAIQAFERSQEVMDITEMRNRIEHCALPTDDHLERIKKLNLIAASSIGFLYDIGDSYLTNLGKERMKRVYPHQSFKEYGIVAPGNSDLPVTDGNPWTGIYSAVTRKTISGQTLDETQNISVYDALKAYTVDAAYSSCEEEMIGVIKPSAKADIIVLSENPLEMDHEGLKDIEIEETYIDGKLVYKK